MLHIERISGEKSTRIIVRNRLLYALAMDGVSQEETYRLAGKLYEDITNENSDIGDIIHEFWWENQKIAVIVIMGEIMDDENIDIPRMKEVIMNFESENVVIPHLSIMSGIVLNNIPAASRLGMISKDKDGEFAIFTSEELFTGCIRN